MPSGYPAACSRETSGRTTAPTASPMKSSYVRGSSWSATILPVGIHDPQLAVVVLELPFAVHQAHEERREIAEGAHLLAELIERRS